MRDYGYGPSPMGFGMVAIAAAMLLRVLSFAAKEFPAMLESSRVAIEQERVADEERAADRAVTKDTGDAVDQDDDAEPTRNDLIAAGAGGVALALALIGTAATVAVVRTRRRRATAQHVQHAQETQPERSGVAAHVELLRAIEGTRAAREAVVGDDLLPQVRDELALLDQAHQRLHAPGAATEPATETRRALAVGYVRRLDAVTALLDALREIDRTLARMDEEDADLAVLARLDGAPGAEASAAIAGTYADALADAITGARGTLTTAQSTRP